MARNRISFVEGRMRSFSIARSRAVVMLFSFMLASLFWFLVNLNKSYQAELFFPAKITGIPDTIKVYPNSFSRVGLSVEGLGGNLMTYLLKFQRDTLEIPFSKGAKSGFLPSQSFANSWQRNLKGIQLLNVLTPDSFQFVIDYQVEKTLPLESHVDVRLATSYVLESAPVLFPESVRVVGPQKVLDTLKSWRTEEVPTTPLSREQLIRVGVLDTFKNIRVAPEFAHLRVKPRLYSQTALSVPIKVTNVPANVDVKLQYERIEITCLVPIDIFESIQSQSYEVVMDYQKFDLRIPYFLPDYSFLPKSVKVVFSKPHKIPYVIVRK